MLLNLSWIRRLPIVWGIVFGLSTSGVVEVLSGDPCALENGLKWGAFKDFGCFCGSRKFGARLWNIKGKWEDVFPRTPGRYTPSGPCVLPNKCQRQGFLGVGGEWGYFYRPDGNCVSPIAWKNSATDKGCAQPLGGFRRWESKLMNIGKGVDWKECCDVFVRGLHMFKGQETYRATPTPCVVGWTGVFGTFDIYDPKCLPKPEKQICYPGTLLKRQDGGPQTDASGTFEAADKAERDKFQAGGIQNGDPTGPTTILNKLEGAKKDLESAGKGNGGGTVPLNDLDKRGSGFPVNPLFAYVVLDGAPEIRIDDIQPINYGNKTVAPTICGPLVAGVGCPGPILITFPLIIGVDDRVERLVACIRRCNIGTGTATDQHMRDRAHALGEPNDDAGHIVGRQMGGRGTESRNIYPQNIHCNRGNTGGLPGNNRGWREAEDYIRGRAESVGFVYVVYQLHYPNQAQHPNAPDQNRPLTISVEVYERDGNVSGFVVDNPSNNDA